MSSTEQQQVVSENGGRGTRPRLVVGDDGSAAADVVWLWVNNHSWPGWRVSVVTARVPELGPPVGAERSVPRPWDPPHPRAFLAADDVEVDHLLAETDPRLALGACSDATLLAVGPRGAGLLKQLHIGSTTEWLLGAESATPVVVVRSARATRSVLLCTDGSAHARSARSALLDLPWLAQCQVQVLGVDDGHTRPAAAVAETVAVLRGAGVEMVEGEVVDAYEHTGTFDARTVIGSRIAEAEPDLVALGARGTSGIRGLLVGSVTTLVVRHATCSVLVARDPADA